MPKKINPILLVKNLKKNYDNLEVLAGIDLIVQKNEIMCLLGPSGSGKSTLMNILSGLLDPTEGEIIFDGMNITRNGGYLDNYRTKSVSMVFQNFALIDHLTVGENLILANWYNQPEFEGNVKSATKILRKMGLIEHMSKYPNQLSAGQKQRIGIARALIKNPRIIFADEPTGALDTQNSDLIMKMLSSSVRKSKIDGNENKLQNRSLIYSTHNIELVRYADRVFMLKNGLIQPIDKQQTQSIESVLELY